MNSTLRQRRSAVSKIACQCRNQRNSGDIRNKSSTRLMLPMRSRDHEVTAFPTPIAGQIVNGLTALATPLQFKIASTVAQVLYAGFVPGLVGVYQFNVVVPRDAATGDLPVEVTFGADVLAQKLFLPVQK